MPPDVGMNFGLEWAKRSRLRHEPTTTLESSITYDELGRPTPTQEQYLGEDKEHLVLYTKSILSKAPHIQYYIYGHRHIELDLMLSTSKRLLILGDTYQQFTYAKWDGKTMTLHNFE